MYKANILTNKINKTSGSKLVSFIYQTVKDWKGTNTHGEWVSTEAQALHSADEQENLCNFFLKSNVFNIFLSIFFRLFCLRKYWLFHIDSVSFLLKNTFIHLTVPGLSWATAGSLLSGRQGTL